MRRIYTNISEFNPYHGQSYQNNVDLGRTFNFNGLLLLSKYSKEENSQLYCHTACLTAEYNKTQHIKSIYLHIQLKYNNDISYPLLLIYFYYSIFQFNLPFMTTHSESRYVFPINNILTCK